MYHIHENLVFEHPVGHKCHCARAHFGAFRAVDLYPNEGASPLLEHQTSSFGEMVGLPIISPMFRPGRHVNDGKGGGQWR